MADNEESFICSICLMFESERSPDWFVTTPNGHIFHSKCIMDWMNHGHPSCPNCYEHLEENNLTRLRGIDPTSKRKLNTLSRRQGIAHNTTSGTTTIDYTFTICMLGASGTGKSCLIERFTTGLFNESTPTVGSDIRFLQIQLGGKTVHLKLWDTGGQERFNAISQNYVRNAHGVLMVFSYDNPEETILKSTEHWVDFIKQNGLPGAAVLLAGNKIDLKQEQRSKFTTRKAQDLSRSLGLSFFETSAKDHYNVEAAFMALVAEIIQRVESNRLEYDRPDQGRLKLKKKSKKKKSMNTSCCY